MRSLNFLKACAVNSFLKALNNPSEIEGFISDHSILSEQGKADFANFLYEDSLKEENPEIKQAIEECASMWTPAFILAVINANRSSVPYTIQDVDNASAANADILTFGKAGCMDTTMAPSLSKALNTGSVQGYRILPEQELNKAKKGTPQYEEWLRKYREKRGAKSKQEESKEKKEAKEILEEKFRILDLDQDQLDYVKDSIKNDGFVLASVSDEDFKVLADTTKISKDKLIEKFPSLKDNKSFEECKERYIVFDGSGSEEEEKTSEFKEFKFFRDTLNPKKGNFNIDYVE